MSEKDLDKFLRDKRMKAVLGTHDCRHCGALIEGGHLVMEEHETMCEGENKILSQLSALQSTNKKLTERVEELEIELNVFKASAMHKLLSKMKEKREEAKAKLAATTKERDESRTETEKVAEAANDNHDSLLMARERIKSLEAKLSETQQIFAHEMAKRDSKIAQVKKDRDRLELENSYLPQAEETIKALRVDLARKDSVLRSMESDNNEECCCCLEHRGHDDDCRLKAALSPDSGRWMAERDEKMQAKGMQYALTMSHLHANRDWRKMVEEEMATIRSSSPIADGSAE